MKKSLKILSTILLVSPILVGCGNNTKSYDENKVLLESLKAAYNVASDKGFQGTFDDFVIKIKGDKGDAGDKGDNGLSAYEIFLKYHPNYTGSEREWIDALVNGNTSNCEHLFMPSVPKNEFFFPGFHGYRDEAGVYVTNDLICSKCGAQSRVVLEKYPSTYNYVEYRIFDIPVRVDVVGPNDAFNPNFISLNTKITNPIDNKKYLFKGWDKNINFPTQDHILNGIVKEFDPSMEKTITVNCSEDDVPFVNQVAENFIADYPSYSDYVIDVQPEYEHELGSKLKANPNAVGDVFHISNYEIKDLASLDLLYEIDPSYLVDNGTDAMILENGQYNGKQYAIPYTANTYFMFYDASIYTEEDVKSFDKMLSVDVSKYGYDYNFALDIYNGWYQQSLFLSNGCSFYEPNRNMISPQDKALESSHFIWDYLSNSKLYPFDGSAECGYKNAACITGTWNASRIKECIESNGGKYAAAPLPAIKLGKNEVTWKPVADYKHVGVNAITKHPEISCAFANYLTNAKSEKLRYEMRYTDPINEKTFLDTSIDWDASAIALSKQSKNTCKQPDKHTDYYYWDNAVKFAENLSKCTEDEIANYFDVLNQSLASYR